MVVEKALVPFAGAGARRWAAGPVSFGARLGVGRRPPAPRASRQGSSRLLIIAAAGDGAASGGPSHRRRRPW